MSKKSGSFDVLAHRKNSKKRYWNILIEAFTRSWLDHEIAIYLDYIKKLKQTYKKNYRLYESDEKYHPLAKLWFSDSIFDVLRIIELGQVLKTLKGKDGFDYKLKKLMNTPTEFEKLLYEFRIASEFHKLGWDVSFPETPDLIVSSGSLILNVECKKKDINGGKDLLRKKIFKNISTSVLNRLRTTQLNYIIIVKCKMTIEPKDSPTLEKSIIDAIKYHKEPFSNEKFDIIIPTAINDKNDIPYIDYPVNTENEIKERFVYSLTNAIFGEPINPDFSVFGGVTPQKDGLSFYNLKFIAFLSEESLNRFSSVENSFDEAIKQIPKDKTGLIYIELDSKITPFETKEISERLKGKLVAHPRINQMNLTREIIEKTTDGNYIKGIYYKKIANESSAAFPENTMVPGDGKMMINTGAVTTILNDMALKYSPDGTFRPFGKNGTSILMEVKPRFQDKIQYYIDLGNSQDKNRCSLLYDGKSHLILRIFSFSGNCVSLEVLIKEGAFFDDYHIILCTISPLRGEIKINIDGDNYIKRVEPFYLEDVSVNAIMGCDISKKHFAKMELATTKIWSRVFNDDEIDQIITHLYSRTDEV